jgi:uncharacterized protein YbjT (DUF2867 family)
MAETILETGATGTLVKQTSNYTEIKAAAHSVNRIINLEGERVMTVALDYNKPESMKEALGDVDKLFLLTPDAPNAHELASNLVNEARTAGVRHIVKQSMIGADLKANAEVMRLHRQAEQIIPKYILNIYYEDTNHFQVETIVLCYDSLADQIVK